MDTGEAEQNALAMLEQGKTPTKAFHEFTFSRTHGMSTWRHGATMVLVIIRVAAVPSSEHKPREDLVVVPARK